MVYNCIIMGGGIGGLSLAIQLADAQKRVLLVEKETYPFNKVCGEYMSNESISFLATLGLDVAAYNTPVINNLLLSSVSGITIKRPLDIGGRGISRYVLDAAMASLAAQKGVTVLTGKKVENVSFENDVFTVRTKEHTYQSKIVCGAFGRRSNLDVQLQRQYRATKDDLYIGVKYHLKTNYDPNRVELHNFEDGYCGMSAIEDGKVNMSYISKASNLQASGNDIATMERNILSVNPYLGKYFREAEILTKPVVISHVSFDMKTPVEQHILLLGDAAGTIAPLSGNGMSMAIAASKLATGYVVDFLSGTINRQQMEAAYTAAWYKLFKSRTKNARLIQAVFGRPLLNNMSFALFKAFPFIVDIMSRRIHGERF